MKYTSWNKNSLLELKNKLTSEYTPELGDDILGDLYLINQLINNSIKLFPLPPTFNEKITNDIIIMQRYDYFLEEIQYLANLRSQIPVLNNYDLTTYRYLDTSTILGFTHDFYNSLDREIANHFNRAFKKRKCNIKFTNERSSSTYLPYSKTSYINIQKSGTINEFFECIHEYGHSIADNMYFRDSYENYPFIELAPIFFTILAYDEVNRSFEDLEEDITICKVVEAKTIAKHANMISQFSKYYSLTDEILNRKRTTKDMCRKLNKKHTFIRELLEINNIERYAYVLPYLVAIELYHLYLEDPELALYKLKTLIRLDPQEEYQSILDELNINLNENSKDHIKKLNK